MHTLIEILEEVLRIIIYMFGIRTDQYLLINDIFQKHGIEHNQE